MATMTIGVGALKPDKIRKRKLRSKEFATSTDFGLKMGNKITVPMARSVRTKSS